MFFAKLGLRFKRVSTVLEWFKNQNYQPSFARVYGKSPVSQVGLSLLYGNYLPKPSSLKLKIS